MLGMDLARASYEPLAWPRLSKPLPWTSRPMLQWCPVTSSGASQSLRPVSTRGRRESSGLALVWSGRQKSNLRPDAPKATALPTALRPEFLVVNWHAVVDSNDRLPESKSGALVQLGERRVRLSNDGVVCGIRTRVYKDENLVS